MHQVPLLEITRSAFLRRHAIHDMCESAVEILGRPLWQAHVSSRVSACHVAEASKPMPPGNGFSMSSASEISMPRLLHRDLEDGRARGRDFERVLDAAQGPLSELDHGIFARIIVG